RVRRLELVGILRVTLATAFQPRLAAPQVEGREHGNATSKIEKGGLLSESANRVDHGAGRLLGDVFQLWVLGAEHAPGCAKQMRGDRGHQRSERCFVAALDVS